MHRRSYSLCALLSLALTVSTAAVASEKDQATIDKDKLGSTPNVTRFGKTLFGGQPDPAAMEEATRRGIEVLVTFREEGEVDWDEAEKAKSLGLKFYRFGFRAPTSLDDTLIDQARKVLVESREKPTMLYCGSANRVGAIWMAHRALDGGLSVADALEEGQKVGLRSAGYVEVVEDYIRRQTGQGN